MRFLVVALILAAPVQAAADPFIRPPDGYTDLLARRPDLAFEGWGTWREDMALLRRVNRQVNNAKVYHAEVGDAWGIGSDCEDYAVRKLEVLLEEGVPRGALRLAAGKVAGRAHAVLVVKDLWVLDSLQDEIFKLNTTAVEIDAWETTKGRWTAAGPFANLADHLRWSHER